MMRRFIYVTVAMGAVTLSGAMGQTFTGVALEENDTGLARRETLPIPAVITTPGAQLPPPGGNPLWGIPLSTLNATRDRPVFTASRRRPEPPIAAAPLVEAPTPTPPPAEPEKPLLTLVGTAIGETENVAVVLDQSSKNLVRLHVGEAVSGWFLRSVDARAMTVEKDSQIVTLALPAANSSPSGPADVPEVPEALQASREF
ncbi:MAG: general secretion pathway protein GspN [Beijerinckiaceae bacterium]|nr:general secretion pathway protein GspN [Beijerinckiaceae bacterium]MCI0736096.1 general secretion pathway protein GspN [Beijerinckiaceae bacterium]